MIKAVLNAAEVKARLVAMGERSRRNTFKRVMRKVAKPVVQELRKNWKAARRRRGKVTGDIARAQRATVDMRKNAVGVLKIGADYRRGGNAKLWHILENGFTHRSNTTVIGRRVSRPIAQKHQKRLAEQFRNELAREVLSAARGRKAAA